MMLILAVCKVLVTFEPSVHLSLPISNLQPSGRAFEREIRRCGVRIFQFVSGSFQNENKILHFLLIFFLLLFFFTAFTSQLPSCQRDEELNGVEVSESVLNINKPSEGVFLTNWWEGTVFQTHEQILLVIALWLPHLKLNHGWRKYSTTV